MVRSQTTNLTPGPSFDHNSCYRCPNGSCRAILDIYTSRPFQWYKEHFNARCFDPYNGILSFQESRGAPKSHFRECEWRPHTSFKGGCDSHQRTSQSKMGHVFPPNRQRRPKDHQPQDIIRGPPCQIID